MRTLTYCLDVFSLLHHLLVQANNALAMFELNTDFVLQVNAASNTTYWLSLNQFSALAPSYFQSNVLMNRALLALSISKRKNANTNQNIGRRKLNAVIAQFVNWTSTGRTTPVRHFLADEFLCS